jgi:hypothetical protein
MTATTETTYVEGWLAEVPFEDLMRSLILRGAAKGLLDGDVSGKLQDILLEATGRRASH